MRLSAVFAITALGCSSGSFEVASTTDTGAGADDTAMVTDASTDTGESDASDDAAPVDGGGGTTDAGPEVIASTCSNTVGCKLGSEYCKLAHCGDPTGTCVALGPVSPVYAPVCGCDNVTYWSESFAASLGVSISHSEPCLGPEGVTCDVDSDCGTAGLCVRDLSSTIGTCAATGKGRCWKKPAETDCAMTVSESGGAVQTCSGSCKTRCQAIKDHSNFRNAFCAPG